MSSKKYCECGAKLGYFRKKNGRKKWVPSKKKDHTECQRCWVALKNAIKAQLLRGRKEPEIP